MCPCGGGTTYWRVVAGCQQTAVVTTGACLDQFPAPPKPVVKQLCFERRHHVVTLPLPLLPRPPPCHTPGRDDPWVVPIWGQRLKRQLPSATYLELAPAGHCPHHEAPTAINSIIRTWVAAVEEGQHTGGHDLLQVGRGWLRVVCRQRSRGRSTKEHKCPGGIAQKSACRALPVAARCGVQKCEEVGGCGVSSSLGVFGGCMEACV